MSSPHTMTTTSVLIPRNPMPLISIGGRADWQRSSAPVLAGVDEHGRPYRCLSILRVPKPWRRRSRAPAGHDLDTVPDSAMLLALKREATTGDDRGPSRGGDVPKRGRVGSPDHTTGTAAALAVLLRIRVRRLAQPPGRRLATQAPASDTGWMDRDAVHLRSPPRRSGRRRPAPSFERDSPVDALQPDPHLAGTEFGQADGARSGPA